MKINLISKKNHDELIKYIITGIISNSISYIFFIVLVYIFLLNYKIAISILYLCALLNNFTINRFWTFKSKKNYRSSLVYFLFFYFVGYLVNMTLLKLFVDDLLFPVGYVQGYLILFLAAYYYLVNKYFIHN
jgi:putative flippase GtrA